MTTTLAAPTRLTHSSREETRDKNPATPTSFVLTITGMPVRLRGQIEQLMAYYLPPAEVVTTPGVDIWDVHWFTRWHRDTTTFGARGLRCREVISADEGAACEFMAQLRSLAHEYGFSATLDKPSLPNA